MTVPGLTPYTILGGFHGGHWGSTSEASCDSSYQSDITDPRTQPIYVPKKIVAGELTDAIDNAGIRAGEIIGHRAWQLISGSLYSMFANYMWEPKKQERACSRYGGICLSMGYHAFKSSKDALRHYSCYSIAGPVVIGSIAMWGDVIEHEKGWRSEYAAIHSLDFIHGSRKWFWQTRKELRELRRRYDLTVSGQQ